MHVINRNTPTSTTQLNEASDERSDSERPSQDSPPQPAAGVNHDDDEFKYCPKGLTPNRFKTWQKNRPWLKATADGKVYCEYCNDIKDLGPHTKKCVRIDKAFVDGILISHVAKKAVKKMNDKISDHSKALSHKLCSSIIETRKKNEIGTRIEKSADLWKEQNKKKIEVTTRVFRTVYMCCKRSEPFAAHPELINLQELNGLDVGRCLYSDHSCRNITCYIAEKMRNKLTAYIVSESNFSFSLMFDESTSVSTETCLILYIRTEYDKRVCNFFLDLIHLESQTGKDIADAVCTALTQLGFTKDVLQKRLIGVCTDGASNLQGAMKGALAIMKTELQTDFVVFHCMAHKLELAVHDVLKIVTELEHFRMFVDTLYSHFSRSPKNQNELKAVAENLHVQLLQVVRTFDVRWVASSFRSVCAIWQSYPALVGHFHLCSTDSYRNARERVKCGGMHKKLSKWFFVCELAIIKDALEPIKSLSLYFQTREASVITADAQIATTIETLKAMKTNDGVSTLEFFDEFSQNSCFRGVPLEPPSDAERKKFCELKAKFFQGLVDNLTARFTDTGSVMHNATVLQKDQWPISAEKRILFGDREVVELCKSVKLSHDTAAIVHQYRLLKNGKAFEAGAQLNELNQRLTVLPISSAECERGFSSMNSTHTAQRNALDISTVRDLLFVNLNGPPLKHFNAEKYASMWIKDGRHSASDKPSGRKAPDSDDNVQHHCKLFM